MNTIRLTLLLLTTAVGCSSDATPILPDSQRLSNVQKALDHAFADSNQIIFRTNNGHWIGTDGDTDIELRADGTAIVTDYGIAVWQYEGTYSIDRESSLTFSLKDFPLPAMALYEDESELLLIPAENSSDAAPYWPLRQIPLKMAISLDTPGDE